jgi:hypothetical protein
MNAQYWEKELYIILNALGRYPTSEQLDFLEVWIKSNVPAAEWGNVAWSLPSDLCTDFRMYAAENGDY